MSQPMLNLQHNFSGLSVDSKKKKRAQRAFHEPSFAQPPAFQSSPVPAPFSPGMNSQTQTNPDFTPNPNAPYANANVSTPMLHSGWQTPATPSNGHFNQTNPALASPGPSNLATPNLAAGNLAAGNEQDDLSLCAARHLQQAEFCTPGYDDQGNPTGYRSFLSFQNIVPPMAGTQFHAVDQSTATPRHIRSTMYNVPESESLRKETRLPMAVTLRPFAPLLPSESPVPVVDMAHLGESQAKDLSDIGPPRCNRCRAFINPSMMHKDTGKFTCNVCQFTNNSVPIEYSAVVDPYTNQRADREARPELHRGVYDIIVPSYYNVGGADHKPQPLHHVFLLDVSHQSVAKQLPVLVADALRAAIFDYNEEFGSETVASSLKFAFILFDKKMHFYNLAPDQDTAQLRVSSDLDDPFVPFSSGLFADPVQSRAIIEDSLNHMESLCNDHSVRDAEPCFSVAVRTAALCLEQVGGGKITSVLSTLSSWGPGRSKIKENSTVGRALSAEAEKALYSPDNEYYKLLGKDLIAQNVGLDIFVISDTPADLSNIGWLATSTGGSVSRWSNFSFERDGRSVSSQIVGSIRKCTGYQGLLKLRCSNGLQVSQYYGFPAGGDSGIVGYANGSSPDPVIPVLNEDQTFTVLLEYDGTLDTKYDCHFQASVLYTDPQGVRKVRVINLVLAVSERLHDVFNFVDQDAVVTTIVRDTISFIGKESINELRKSLNEKLVDVFASYRKMSEQQSNRNALLNGQLIFPDALKHLPSFILTFIKSKALRDSTGISSDQRLNDIFQMLYMPVEKLTYHLYPALVELHSLADDEGMPYADEENVDGFIKLPEFKSLTASSLQSSVYILCNGTTVYVRIHPDSNELLLKDLFGDHVQSIRDIDPHLDAFPDLPNHISEQARNLVSYFREKIIGSSSIDSSAIVIVRDGIDAITQEFRECLVEDQLPSKTANTAPNFPEFLASLHRAVRVKVEGDTKHRTEVGHKSETLAQRMIQF